MNIEIETKVLDIIPEEIEEKLKVSGAKKIADKFFKIWSYKIDDNSSDVEEHIRLRDEQDKITLTYKKKSGSGLNNTEEIEFEVSDFEKARQFLSKFEFNGVFYQERKRTIYHFEDIEFSIDYWPGINPLLEIEGPSEERVNYGLKILGLEGQDVGNISIVKVYKEKGLDIHSFKELKF